MHITSIIFIWSLKLDTFSVSTGREQKFGIFHEQIGLVLKLQSYKLKHIWPMIVHDFWLREVLSIIIFSVLCLSFPSYLLKCNFLVFQETQNSMRSSKMVLLFKFEQILIEIFWFLWNKKSDKFASSPFMSLVIIWSKILFFKKEV